MSDAPTTTGAILYSVVALFGAILASALGSLLFLRYQRRLERFSIANVLALLGGVIVFLTALALVPRWINQLPPLPPPEPGYNPPPWPGVLAALLATLLAVRAANRLRSHPRLFTALVLVAVNWGIVADYYARSGPKIVGINAFVLFLAGRTIRREAVASSDGQAVPVSFVDTWALMLFLGSVLAPFGLIDVSGSLALQTRSSRDLMQAAFSMALTTVAYASLTHAMWLLVRGKIWFLGAALAAYWIGELSFFVQMLFATPSTVATPFWYAFFILMKLVVTLALGALCIGHARASRTPWHALGHLVRPW